MTTNLVTKYTIYPKGGDLTQATQIQKEMFQLLEAIGWGEFDLRDLRDRLQLRSILPVQSRIQHLAGKGIIAIS